MVLILLQEACTAPERKEEHYLIQRQKHSTAQQGKERQVETGEQNSKSRQGEAIKMTGCADGSNVRPILTVPYVIALLGCSV